jgi:hypothetical protein
MVVWVFISSNSSTVSLPGLPRIASGIAILPTSCSGGGQAEQLDLGLGQPQALRDGDRQIADAARVLAGVVVPELGGRGEPGEHLELRLLELPAGPPGLGDVLDLAEELGDLVVLVADRGQRDARLDDPATAVQVALVERRLGAAAQQRGDDAGTVLAIIGMGEV